MLLYVWCSHNSIEAVVAMKRCNARGFRRHCTLPNESIGSQLRSENESRRLEAARACAETFNRDGKCNHTHHCDIGLTSTPTGLLLVKDLLARKYIEVAQKAARLQFEACMSQIEAINGDEGLPVGMEHGFNEVVHRARCSLIPTQLSSFFVVSLRTPKSAGRACGL